MVRLEFITLGSHPLLILYQIISRDSKIDNLFRLILQVTPTTGQMSAVGGKRYEVLSYTFTRTVSVLSLYLLLGAICGLYRNSQWNREEGKERMAELRRGERRRGFIISTRAEKSHQESGGNLDWSGDRIQSSQQF